MSLRDLEMQENNVSFCFLSSPGFSKNISFLDMWLTFPTREQTLRDKERGPRSSEGIMLGTRLHISLHLYYQNRCMASPEQNQEGLKGQAHFMCQFDWNKGCLDT